MTVKTKMIQRGVATLAGAVMIAMTVAVPATAHTSVRETDPADGATLGQAPASVSVTFGGPVQSADLKVIDPCGTQVDKKDVQFEQVVPPREGEPEGPGSRVTVSMSGAMAGRYEMQWFAQPMDGDLQSGFTSFYVTEGTRCTDVKRTDAKGDVEGSSIDLLGLTARVADAKLKLQIDTAEPVACAALGAELDETKKNSILDVIFETEQDGEEDLRGRIVCRAGRTKLRLTSMDEKTKYGAYKVAKRRASLVTNLPLTLPLRPEVGKYIDITMQSESLEEKCGDGCFDRGPDLGYLSVAAAR